jgi:uncharacterized protein YbaR (Trm112 family)
MFVELIDLLRCPHPHDDSWLVATADETVARHVVRGTLGCPVCEAEYPIRDGVADFGDAPDAAVGPPLPPDPDDAVRLAAFLGVTSPGGALVVGGAWRRVAPDVAELAGVRVLVLDPPLPEPTRGEVSGLRGGGAIPVAATAVRGVALDSRTADDARLAAAVRALAPRGRLVAPAHAPVPEGVREMARDDRLWIAERDADAPASRPVAISRPRRDGR